MFKRSKRKRNMRKIFQWQEYLNWRELTPEQKIKAAKQRIKELQILINLWTNKKVNTIRL